MDNHSILGWIRDQAGLDPSQTEPQQPNTQKMANGKPYTGPTETGIQTAPEVYGALSYLLGGPATQGVLNAAKGAGMTIADLFSGSEGPALAMKAPIKAELSALGEGGPIHPDFSKVLGRPVSVLSPITNDEANLLLNKANQARETMGLAHTNAEIEDVLRGTAKALGKTWDPKMFAEPQALSAVRG